MASRARYTARQAADDSLRDDVYRDGVWIGSAKGPYKSKRGHFYEWRLVSVSSRTAPPFGRSAASGESRSRRAAIARVIAADKKRRAEHAAHYGPKQLAFASMTRSRA